MPGEDTNIQILIEAVNKSQREFAQVKRQLSDLENRSKKTGKAGKAAGGMLQEGMKEAANAAGRANSQAGRFLSTLGGFKTAAVVVGGVATAMLAIAAAARKGKNAYREYETGLADMDRVTDEDASVIDQKIMGIVSELGKASELVQGYYQVISAGVKDPAKAMDTLTTSAKAAKAAHLGQAETIKGVTKLMAGYSGEIENATDATDLLFSIEKEGQTQFSELVPIIGDVSSVAAQSGAAVEEMAAMLAVATQTAGSTSQAATQTRAVLMGLIKPQERMRDLLADMGYQSGVALVQERGLAGAIQSVAARAQAANIPLGMLFESAEALTALGPMLADGFTRYNAALAEMENRAGRTERAFDRWMDTMAATEERLFNTIDKVATKVGKELAPEIKGALNDMSDWVEDNEDKLVNFFSNVVSGLEAVAGALGYVIDGVNWLAKQGDKGYANELARTIFMLGEMVKGNVAPWDKAMWFGGAAQDYVDTVTDPIKTEQRKLAELQAELKRIQNPSTPYFDREAISRESDRLREEIALSEEKLRILQAQSYEKQKAARFAGWNAEQNKTLPGGAVDSSPQPGGTDTGGSGGMTKEEKERQKKWDKALTKDAEETVKGIMEELQKRQDALEAFSAEYRRLVGGDLAFELAEVNAHYDKLREYAEGNAETQAQIEEARAAKVQAITEKHNAEQLAASRDLFDGLKRGLEDWVDKATNAGQQAEAAITGALDRSIDALVDFSGDWKSLLSDLASYWKDTLLRMGLEQGTGWLFDQIGSLLSGSSRRSRSSSSGGGILSWLGFELHGGGNAGEDGRPRLVDPEWFVGAAKHHLGMSVPRLVPGEVAAILSEDERVYRPDQEAALRGGSYVNAPTFNLYPTINGSTGSAQQDQDYADRVAKSMVQELDAWWDQKFAQTQRPRGAGNKGVTL